MISKSIYPLIWKHRFEDIYFGDKVIQGVRCFPESI